MQGAGWLLVTLQSIAVATLVIRLLPGRTRRAPVSPDLRAPAGTTVSVIVATLNEAKRIGPCLQGLMEQGPEMIEAIVVDSNSSDGTRELVLDAARRDARIRLMTDPPLPDNWIGKVWALETGLRAARGTWVLGIDADTQPMPSMTAAVVGAAVQDNFDVASFAPRFAGQGAAERWLQPAMLLSLVYRTGAAGAMETKPDRVLANGQCFLARRELLLENGGYAAARESFSDDVTLARHLARKGARVGFLDGSRVIDVRAYESMTQMWREWGRSFDLKDSATAVRRMADLAFTWLVQGIPLAMLLLLALQPAPENKLWLSLATLNATALFIRIAMLFALRNSYATRGLPFWLSWSADIPASVRLTISTMRRPTQWRGRSYQRATPIPAAPESR